jgi:hypothetical protein
MHPASTSGGGLSASRETFTRVPLQWDGERYTDNLTQHRLLQGDELNHELIHIALDPVPQVFAQLSKDATPKQP